MIVYGIAKFVTIIWTNNINTTWNIARLSRSGTNQPVAIKHETKQDTTQRITHKRNREPIQTKTIIDKDRHYRNNNNVQEKMCVKFMRVLYILFKIKH